MGSALSLIPELEHVIQHGSRERREETLERVTALFLGGADRYSDQHVDLFDDIFGLLIAEIETKARAALSGRLAPIDNAPIKLLRTLANDDDIAVAGPVLKLAPRLAEADLIGVARTKSQAHLKAISARHALAESVTDELVRRGDRDVARRLADNRGARISEKGFYRLVKRAEEDGILAEKVGLRPDIPLPMFRDLLTKATAVVQKRLLASATPEVRAAVCDVLVKVSKEVGARVGPRDYRAGATRGAVAAPGRTAERDDGRFVLQPRQIRVHGRGARRARQGADRGGRPADERGPPRHDTDSLQGGRSELGDGQGHHHGASGRQRDLELRARHGIRQLWTAVDVDRAPRGALLASAETLTK